MSKGVEAELIVVFETFLPLSIFTPGLRDFYSAYPMVQLRINAVRPQDASWQLLENRADFGLFLLSPKPEPDLESLLITEIDLVAVAVSDHPLAKLPPHFPNEAMRDHLQIIVSDPKAVADSTAYGVVGVNQWRVSDVRLRYDLVKDGMPRFKIVVARRNDKALGPAGNFLMTTLVRGRVLVD